MALTRAEVWRTIVLAALRNSLPFEMVANKTFKEEIWKKGDTLHILTEGAVTHAPYTDDNITYQDLTDSEVELKIDKEEYSAIKDEDTNKILTNNDYLAKVLSQMGYQLADYWDQLGMSEYSNCGLDSYSTGTTPWQITATTAANLPALFGAMSTQLIKAKAPKGLEKYFLAPPEIEQALNLYFGANGPASQKSDDVIVNGFAGNYFGWNIFTTNNCKTASSVTHGLAGVMGQSIALANDVITDEGIRTEGRFATGYRMLTIGGIKTFRPSISIDVNLNETVIAGS